MAPGRVLLMLLRVLVIIQLVVGIALWAGHGLSLVGMHMLIGIVFVLLLWSIAIIAMAKRQRIGLGLFALVWGLVVVAVGMTQQRILPGELHWIVRVLHLVISVAAMPIAEKLASLSNSGHPVRLG